MSVSDNKRRPGKPETAMEFTSDFSEGCRPARTIRLRDIVDPQPVTQRRPVPIRPPSPRPPHLHSPQRGRVSRQSFSCEPAPRPIIQRRAQSLPSSARRGSQVRFVDSLGLDLEKVKVFQAGEEPLIPVHVISRLLASSELASGKNLELSLPYFQPCFSENMAEEPNFLDRLLLQRVCLERIYCSELGIVGTVQVLNLAFEKGVTVFYSFTDWKSSAEAKACWVSTMQRDGSQPESDVFRFRLPVPPFILKPGAVLQFVIRYRVLGAEYWDNNDRHNYKLICHTYKLSVPKECEESMVHFT